ncbi:CASP8-associated protein 2 isoform X2 [Notechis scutatus]|uniref:CASP8-associated protein 2 n=1 Tax=Notechis scutatus TaxID=8663 RepID=A0A6J1TVC5_9SAUR|nr:CASP8-associated protein 2 isoform X2 [Notechis scutatus]
MGTEEDEDGMTFSNLHGISYEREDGDESSMDIYDGLDNTPVVSSNCASKVPIKSNLNLFDEILIEEETAKEATFNELQAEHEKCKQQLQELTEKLQEIQEKNSLLQSENLSLKKNISALIKTARVEINRKDEEISNLRRRLTEAPVHHNPYSKIYTRNVEGSKQKNKSSDFFPDNNSKTDPKNKQDTPRDVSHNSPSWDTGNKKVHLEKKDTSYISQSHPEQFHNDGVPTKLSKLDSSCDKEKEKREIKNNEHYSKDNDCRHKTKTQRNVGSVVDCKLDTPGKSQVNPEKLVRNEEWNDRKDLKIKSSWCAGNKTDNISSTKEKQSVPKNKLMLKTEHINEDRLEKLQIINQKDFKKENKEESSSRQKNRQPDKYVEQQRAGKTNTPENNTVVRNLKEFSKGYLEDKIKHNDCRKTKGTGDPGLQGGKSSLPHSSNRERKLSNSNKDTRKCEPECTHFKSDKYRTEAKRKSGRDKHRESRNSQTERRSSKETPPKTVKEHIKLKDSAKREKKKLFLPKEIAMIVEAADEPVPIKVEGHEEQSKKSKDLKLSFMQKLNLTLSPAKKQTDKSKIVAQATNEGEMEVPSQEIMLVPKEPINTTSEAKMPLGPCHNGPLQTKSEKTISVSEIKANMQNKTPVEILDSKPCKAFPQNATLQHEIVGNEKFLPLTETEMQDSEEVYVTPSPANPMDPEILLNHSFHDLETGSSVDSDTFRVIDEVNGTDSDSSMAKEESSNCADKNILEYSENESLPLPKTSTEDDKILCVNSSITDPKAADLNPSSPKHGSQMESCNKGLNAVSQTDSNPISVDDDNSILSIDLNHMRYIPIAISPLNSPIRPLGKIFRMETSFKVTNYNTDFAPDSAVDYLGSNHSSELNKENQKPLCSDHKILEESQLNISPDELEEGEIVSDADNEPKIEKKSENSKKLKRKMSPERSNTSKNTYNHKVKSVSPNEGPGKLASGKKSKEKPKDGTIFSKEMKKNKIVSIDCLEKIVQITAEPSTLHEFMQMLKAVRKQVRKDYMKFKIQFPIQQFHKMIDSSVLNFTSLIKYIDFSKMCKSNEAIKVNLCEVIESELNQIKKDTAIEYLFEKQQSDMKKKLWKLVDEQLDYLFDKIKKILLKLCNLISLGTAYDDGKRKRKKGSSKCLDNKFVRQKSKKPSLSAKVKRSEDHVLPKPVVGRQLSKTDHQEINKLARHKNTVTNYKQSHTDSTRPYLPEVAHFKQNSTEDTALKTGKYEKEGLDMIGDPHKSDISCGPLTEQQMSGLTFNLVNDAQMGEMFKSLLQGSGLSEKNIDFIDENQWEFRTPEKQMPEGQNGRNNPAYETEETSRDIQVESTVLDGIKWPIVSPERDSTFLARLQMPIDPNILDENCMFEIPTSPTLKKGEVYVLEKQKSLVSSILLEDLAVSLTIPSPLKSDAHLSFLKPDVLGSVPEDVLNAHFSEDAHLEEEDGSEQDIHLALESDNSSSKSSCSSWANIPVTPGFQYCPSLPMQAVIMEKSNDHFIVKIRRAAPSMSPTDQTVIPDEPLISVIEKGKNEIIYEENFATLTSQSIPSGEIEISKEIINTTDSGKKMDNHIMKKQISHSLEPLKETPVCLAIDSIPGLFEPQQDLHPDTPGDVINTMESLLHKNRQEQSCDISLEVQRPFCNTSQTQNPHLVVSNRASPNDAASEKPPDLQDSPEELRISKVPLEESSNKINQNAAASEVFKLPQTIPMKAFQEKDAPSAKIKDFPVRSIVNPPVEQLPSQNHFDTHIDLTDLIPMENKLNSTDPIEQSGLNYRVRSLCKDQEKPKADSHCEVADISKTEVEENVNWPDMSTGDSSFEKNTTFNIDGQKCPIKLSKERKKRKKETEEASSAKKQRKENNELDLKKTGKNSKSTKERTSVASSLSNTKPASTRDKDLLSSTSSMSPSNLCAKNIIKKKGEVVISWTRNDDRVILLECQKNGPSGKTYTFVAEQLKKTPAQVEERFKQLVKLFKMSTGS